MKKPFLLLSALLVGAMMFAAEKVAVLDGSVFPTKGATMADTIVTQDSIEYTISAGAKYLTSTKAQNHFGNNKSILIPKKAVICNNTAFGDGVTKVEVYANYGASASAAVSVAFSATAFTEEPASFDVQKSLSTLDSVYNMGTVPAGTKYIYLKNTSDKNDQIQLRITYAVLEDDQSPAALNQVMVNPEVRKTIENGHLVIYRNGIRYNAEGKKE